jgi:hypothetical protein
MARLYDDPAIAGEVRYCYGCNQPTIRTWICPTCDDDAGVLLNQVLQAIRDQGEPVRTSPYDSYFGYKPDVPSDLMLDEGI